MGELSTPISYEVIQPPHLQPNEKLDRFVVGRQINKGLMYHVYHAYDPLRNTDICLKLSNGNCQQARSILEQEFRITNRLAVCNNIMGVHDIHIIEYGPSQLVALSMEYAKEGSLANWLEINCNNVDLRRQEGKRFLAEMINILDLLHQQGLPLPDFEPDNLLLVNGHLKLTNLVSRIDYSGVLSPQTEKVFGSPEYKAPERFVATKSSELNIAASIYSFGIIAWQIFGDNAHPPFEGNYEEVKAKQLFLEPPPLLGIEPKLEQVIRRCLSKPSTMRYQTIEELNEDLVGCLREAVDSNGTELVVLCDRLVDTMNEGNVQESCILCQEALNIDPDRSDLLEIKRQLDSVVQRTSHYIEDIKGHISERDINNSLEILNLTVQFNGKPTEEMRNIACMLERRVLECQEYVRCGQTAVAQQNWAIALEYFERAWQMNSCDQGLAGWRSMLVDVVETKCGMEKCIQNGNQSAALYFAEKLDGFITRLGVGGSEPN